MNQKALDKTIVEKTVLGLNKWRAKVRKANPDCVIGLVPTMGALHKGHESLIEKASLECDFVIVTIFVNPTQFGANEDLDKYPRTFDDDLAMCEKHGVSLVFHPEVEEIYGNDSQATTFVEPPQHLVDKLCGKHRPGHFKGVATIVSKLFNIAQVDKAYFGEKDYQQLAVIRALVRDLKFPIEVIGCPIVREDSGLALSSRNTYLTDSQKLVAPELNKALLKLKDEVSKGVDLDSSRKEIQTELAQKFGFEVEYLTLCDQESLEELHEPELPFVILVAAKLGKVRLIDNLIVG